MDAVDGLSIGAIGRRLTRLPASFFLASTYLVFEYVRPQSLYPVMDVIPWGQTLLVLSLVACLIEGRVAKASAWLWLPLGLFSLVIVASSVTAYAPDVSFDELSLWWSWLVAIFVLSSAFDTREKMILGLGVFILCNLKMSQHSFFSWAAEGFRFVRVGASGSPGWFRNSGELGIAMCVFFPIATYYAVGLWPRLSRARRIIVAAVALSPLIAIVASSSRGALLGVAAVAVWFALRSPHRVRMMLGLIVLAPAIWFIVPEGSKARFRSMGEDEDSKRRITYWTDGIAIANEHPLLGIGYKNWIPYYRRYYNPEGEVQHNIFVECVSELGYTGLAVFVLLIGGVAVENARTRRRTRKDGPAPDRFLYFSSYGLDGAMIGYLASGFFVTVLFYPFFWINLAFVMALSQAASAKRVRSAARAVRSQRWPAMRAPQPHGGHPVPS